MPIRTIQNADFGNHLAIPAGGDITIDLPEICDRILFIFEPTVRDEGFDLMLNPDEANDQGDDAAHVKHFIHIPAPPSEGTYLEFTNYFVHSFRLLGPAGSMYSYLGMVSPIEPRTSYTYEI